MIQILSRCASVEGMKRIEDASIRLYTLTVVFVLVEWNNAVFYSNTFLSSVLDPLE
jgi:hypothetical protein